MPYEITLSHLPAGYSMSHAKAGEMVQVLVSEFSTTEDGMKFIKRLEGTPRELLNALPASANARESTVDHMLAIIRRDRTATIYLNELTWIGTIRSKGAIQKGDPVTTDSILDMVTLKPEGVEIPCDAGIVLILSAGWRKGLFFDYGPIVGDPPKDRNYDLPPAFAAYKAYLLFTETLSLTEAMWTELLRQSWFPFIHLRQATTRNLVLALQNGSLIDDLLDEIEIDTKSAVAARLENWKLHPLLQPHFSVIEAAVKHYGQGDYLSATLILYPRIEGVMRSLHFMDPNAPKASQGNLIATTVTNAELPPHPYSLLLPVRFEQYLRDVYFAAFNPKNPDGVSRHTVSHGVVPVSALDRKGATLGLLTLLQLVAMLPPNPVTKVAGA
jgi:hypothetical protein